MGWQAIAYADWSRYGEAVAFVRDTNKASTTHLRHGLGIGFNRAALFLERMTEEGVIARPNIYGFRAVLPSPPAA